MGRLDGKVALITGAGHGQGAAGARLFASEGAAVAVADVNVPNADVSDHMQVEAMVTRTVQEFGALHILYNNAGVMFPGAIDTYDLDKWQVQWSVNVTGPNEYPDGGVGSDSLTEHTVPSGIPLIVADEPADTDTEPVCATSQLYPIVNGPV